MNSTLSSIEMKMKQVKQNKKCCSTLFCFCKALQANRYKKEFGKSNRIVDF